MKCKVTVTFAYTFTFDLYTWTRPVMADPDSRLWWVECLTHWGLKWAAKAKISLIMLFNLPSTISENDYQFDVKTCDFVEKTDNISC